MNLRVTIVGGGNLGLVCAARMAADGVNVTLYTGHVEAWSNDVASEDFEGRRFDGRLADVTDDAQRAAEADLIFLCIPGNVIEEKLRALVPYLKRGIPVASVFSGDGFFFIAEEVLGADWPVMGFQRVPFICRSKIPYRLGGITGYKKELFLAHRHTEQVDEWRQFFERVFETKTTILDNLYKAALVNSNVVLHPARLMSLQKKIEEDGPFQRMPLFYEEWDDVASEWAIRLDDELQAVGRCLGVNLQPLLEYYESADSTSLTMKMKSISAFKGIGSPITESGIFDSQSRYIQADVNVALKYVSRLSHDYELPAKKIDKVLAEFGVI